MPTKGKVTHNQRGEFLVKMKEKDIKKEEKDLKKAREIDVAWLKDFVEVKKVEIKK